MTESKARRLADRIRSGGFLAQDLVQEVPDHLGRYEVLRPLGRGASSEVYLVRDPTMDREVALKILLGLDTDPVRFQREMEVLAGLKHPGIVPIYDSGQHGGRSFFVMEYLGERSLADVVGAISLAEAVGALEQVAEACHVAHEQGVVHRDLKPSNILLADRPVVVDFGVAKLLDPPEGKKGKTTRVGSAVGTPHYMAPEQVTDRPVDRRTDVYALGVILYELATGRLPHHSANFTELALEICEAAPVPPRELNPELPEALEAVVLKALSKDPAARYPDARAFAAALRAPTGEPTTSLATSPTPVWVPWVAVGIVGLVLGWGLGRSSAPTVGPTPGEATTSAPKPTVPSNADAIAAARAKVDAWERGGRTADAAVPTRELRDVLAGLKVDSDPENAQRARALRARVLHDLGDREAALREVEQALALRVDVARGEAQLERAWIGWERLQESPLAIVATADRDRIQRGVVEDLRTALGSRDLTGTRRAGAEVLLELCLAWRAKQYDQAEATLNVLDRVEAAQAPPKSLRYLLRAQLMIMRGDRAKALELLEVAQGTRFQLAITTAAQAVLHLTAPNRDWRELAKATRVARAALAVHPTAPDVQRLSGRVLRLWILNWHAAGGQKVTFAPGTKASIEAVRARLAGQSSLSAREADLTLALFGALGGVTPDGRQTVAEAAAGLADMTRGAQAGPGPWATLAHVELWRCTPAGGKVKQAPRDLSRVLLNARRWFAQDGELLAIERIAKRYGVRVPKSKLSGTRWTLIHAAQGGDSEAIEALSSKYRPPVVAYLARRGAQSEAEDLAQDVFVRLLHDGVLARADSLRGRFRSLVFAVTRNVLGHHLAREQAQKRGGGKVESLDTDVPLPEPDEAFDREWLNHLLETALGRLEREHPPYFEVLFRFLVEEQGQPEIAQALGLTETNVRNRVHRGRKKLIAYLRDEVLNYSTSHEDYGVELKALAKLMGEDGLASG